MPYLFLCLSLVSTLFLVWGYRKAGGKNINSSDSKKSFVLSRAHIALFVLIGGCYLFLLLLLSFSWLQLDEWFFLLRGELGIAERLAAASHQYMTWVSRLGEFLLGLLGFSENRWQSWLITPFFAASAPLALFALAKPSGATIFSLRGCYYYVGIFFLCLLGVDLSWWRNYWCPACSFNYLFPTVLTMYYLSWFRTDREDPPRGWFPCIILFCLGGMCGWGTECMTATLLPLLTLWCLYHLLSRKSKLPLCSYWGYVGFIWGALALFGSPALTNRASLESASTVMQVGDMTPEQLQIFFQDLCWRTVGGLAGRSGVITLSGIPIWEHWRFLPFLAERFLQCCKIPLCLWIVLMLIFVCGRAPDKRRNLVAGIIFAGGSGLCATSYIVQCIPTHVSFLPASFLLIAGCVYLMLRLPSVKLMGVISLLLAVIGGAVFIPSGIQAARLKVYDTMRREEILKRKAAGEQDIVLPSLRLQLTVPSRGLVAPNDISKDSKSYPNTVIAKYYGVRSISQEH